VESLLLRNQKLRQQLVELVGNGSSRDQPPPATLAVDPAPSVTTTPLDVVVTFNEINLRHGTGVLLSRIFATSPHLVTVRTTDTYGGDHGLGMESFRLPDRACTRQDAYAFVQRWFGQLAVRRVLCVPYAPTDALMALALSHTYDAPLVTWIMDDQNVGVAGIPDALMAELLTRSRLRLAISPEMRLAYENKYRLRFWMLPPVVAGDVVRTEPVAPLSAPSFEVTGVLIGNVWGQRWLDLLRETVRGSGVHITWYCNSGLAPPWLQFDRDGLVRDGIRIHEALPEPQLAAVLRQHQFALVPSGTLDEADDNHAVARFSLPTRVPFIVASSNTPMIVLGARTTAVARFVTRFGLGVVADYDGASFGRAVAEVRRPEAQTAMRQRAAGIADAFRADGVSEWIWASLGAGAPGDLRFEAALPPDPADFAYWVEDPVPPDVCVDFHAVYRTLRRLQGAGYRPDFIVDVGASTGVWSHTVRPLFPDAQFVLVEPLFMRYDAPSRQFYVGDRAGMRVFQVALSDRPGHASLAVSSNLYESSLLGLPGGRGETVEVEVTTLDDLITRSGVSGRGMVKIDVQHAEHLVIAGGRQALAEQMDVVILELTLAPRPAGAKSLLEMMNYMDRLGFDYVDDAGEWRSTQGGALLEKDLVFARKGLAR
jgi:FkbM family methyltransferase